MIGIVFMASLGAIVGSYVLGYITGQAATNSRGCDLCKSVSEEGEEATP